MTVTINGTTGIDKVQDGSIQAADLASGVPSRSQLPAGTVLQVVSASYNTEVATTSTSYIDTGLSVSITPTSTTSKILILVSQNLNTQSDNTVYLTINRNSTIVYETFWPIALNLPNQIMINTFEQTLDSPATTSAITYKTQFHSRDAGETVVAQRESHAPSVITLMEIAA